LGETIRADDHPNNGPEIVVGLSEVANIDHG
jgi:hypothetical protein